MTTFETPSLMASKAFWSLGIMPSEIVPSATIGSKSFLATVLIKEEGSDRSFKTPGIDEQKVRVTEYFSAKALATEEAIVSHSALQHSGTGSG